MAITVRGYHSWELDVSHEGIRNYKVIAFVTSDPADGPYSIYLNSEPQEGIPALPQPGDQWNFQADFDEWAYCQYDCKISSLQGKKQDPTRWWTVELTFSTIPFNMRCTSVPLPGDPIQEPAKINISFNKYTKEAVYDINGDLITNSAWQPIRGQTVEFDANRITISIEQNVGFLDLITGVNLSEAMQAVNDDILWDFPARTIKLSNCSIERQLYGNCDVYWKRKLDFEVCDINDPLQPTWDRVICNYSTKVLNGKWNPNGDGTWVSIAFPPSAMVVPGTNPDPNNPAHYIDAFDKNRTPTKLLINSEGTYQGQPADAVDIAAGSAYITVKYYQPYNFLQLAIPTDLLDPTQ